MLLATEATCEASWKMIDKGTRAAHPNATTSTAGGEHRSSCPDGLSRDLAAVWPYALHLI